jgi:hypothetical protein
LNFESGRLVCEPAAFRKGGAVYEALRKQGEVAVHEWIDKRRTRKRHGL